MVPKAKKLLEKLRNHRRGWHSRDLDTILQAYGFEVRQGGKHPVYKHGWYTDLGSYPLPYGDDLPPDYAKDVLTCVEEVIRRERKRRRGK